MIRRSANPSIQSLHGITQQTPGGGDSGTWRRETLERTPGYLYQDDLAASLLAKGPVLEGLGVELRSSAIPFRKLLIQRPVLDPRVSVMVPCKVGSRTNTLLNLDLK